MKENTAPAALLVAVTLLALAALPARADGIGGIAKQLAKAAKRGHALRVAVLPFKSEQGDEKDGAAITERLTTRLAEAGGIQVIERSLLEAMMSEHQLERTGLVAAQDVKPLGRVAPADAVVSGSFVVVGPRVVVDARLIDMETGVVLAAAERTVDRDWSDGAVLAGVDAPQDDSRIWVPAPEFIADVPSLDSAPSAPSDLRDAVASDPCERANDRADDLERQVLDLKARYWAGKLRAGAALRDLKENPGSTISDPALRRSFYERLKFWYRQDAVPSLTSAEVSRFVSTDAKAYSLYQQCGA